MWSEISIFIIKVHLNCLKIQDIASTKNRCFSKVVMAHIIIYINKYTVIVFVHFFGLFSETSSATEQKSISPTKPSLPCLPQTSAPMFRLSDPHGRHRIRRRGRLPGEEVAVETSDETFQSFLHLVSDLSTRGTRLAPHRLVCRTSGFNFYSF